jgi:hypothetical protein
MSIHPLKPFKRYRKYCRTGQHYVSHLVKRYYIMVKFDEYHQPCRVTKQSRVCRQCASYMDDWSKQLKTARLEVVTRNLMQGNPQ